MRDHPREPGRRLAVVHPDVAHATGSDFGVLMAVRDLLAGELDPLPFDQ